VSPGIRVGLIPPSPPTLWRSDYCYKLWVDMLISVGWEKPDYRDYCRGLIWFWRLLSHIDFLSLERHTIHDRFS
jgi:hypothetical protein